jgi:hypothetical protein
MIGLCEIRRPRGASIEHLQMGVAWAFFAASAGVAASSDPVMQRSGILMKSPSTVACSYHPERE